VDAIHTQQPLCFAHSYQLSGAVQPILSVLKKCLDLHIIVIIPKLKVLFLSENSLVILLDSNHMIMIMDFFLLTARKGLSWQGCKGG